MGIMVILSIILILLGVWILWRSVSEIRQRSFFKTLGIMFVGIFIVISGLNFITGGNDKSTQTKNTKKNSLSSSISSSSSSSSISESSTSSSEISYSEESSSEVVTDAPTQDYWEVEDGYTWETRAGHSHKRHAGEPVDAGYHQEVGN